MSGQEQPNKSMDEEKMGMETDERRIERIDNFLEQISEEEIDDGNYSGNINYHIKIGMSQKNVTIENGKAVFEIPINLFMQNEDEYDLDDTMVLACEIDFSDNSFHVTGKQEQDGKPYSGDLDKSYDKALELILDAYKKS